MYSEQDSADWDSYLLKRALSQFWNSTENSVPDEHPEMSRYLGWALGCDWTHEERKLYSN